MEDSTSSQYVFAVKHSLDLMRALLWQYNDAKNLQSIISQKEAWYADAHVDFWENWQRDVFDLYTANDFGLSVWGIILDQGRDAFVGVPTNDYPAWGFGKARKNFNNGNFKRSGAGYQRLSTEQYKLLLQLRYYKLISKGTIPEVNAMLQKLFADQGRVYVLDGLDMTWTFVFSFVPSSWQRFVLSDMDALPRPAGVGVKLRTVTRPTFGFGIFHKNYGSYFTSTNNTTA